MGTHAFVDDVEVVERVDVGGGVVLVRYAQGDESTGGREWAVQHTCARWPDEQEPDGEFVKVVAPRLSPGHDVFVGPEGVTVTPSILCPDCQLHGFVTKSKWRGCA